MDACLSSLERELKEWRENRSRTEAALAESRTKVFSSPSANRGHRRVRVNGQEVLVVSKARRH